MACRGGVVGGSWLDVWCSSLLWGVYWGARDAIAWLRASVWSERWPRGGPAARPAMFDVRGFLFFATLGCPLVRFFGVGVASCAADAPLGLLVCSNCVCQSYSANRS